ncbi:MAG: hypothetical protein M1817_002615 [Caeruleum heppii]|nr:MAG: hypothetical protein M1817_002615 [Caeruleum heppii]
MVASQSFSSSLFTPTNTHTGSTTHGDLFRYTSGRWLYNEPEQLTKRYVEFDVPALKATAGRVVGSTCVALTKLPEGLYNKTFALKMADGRELIARIPNPNAGCPCFTTSSEVATLDFLRTVLDIPVPTVYGWSPDASSTSNSIGAEYILMEKLPGRPLSHVWSSMSEVQRFDLVQQVVKLEAKLARARLTRYGALYHRHSIPVNFPRDVPEAPAVLVDDPQNALAARFVLGPTVERSFWADERGKMDLDRGPWNSAEEYFAAVAKREMAWIRTFGSKQSSHGAPQLQSQRISPEAHLNLLKQFLQLLPHIMPKDKNVTFPTLWHTDLHHDNIFVDTSDPSQITGIIDWQEIWAAPFFTQARFASAFDCDEDYPDGIVMPRLPEDYDDLSETDKSRADAGLKAIKLKKFYEIASRKFNPLLFRAMDAIQEEDDEDVSLSAIFDLVGRSWIDGPIPLRWLLMQVAKKWPGLTEDAGVPCPITFSAEEMARCKTEADAWAESHQPFELLRSRLLGREGWVPHEDYEAAMTRFVAHREELNRLRERFERAGGRDS